MNDIILAIVFTISLLITLMFISNVIAFLSNPTYRNNVLLFIIYRIITPIIWGLFYYLLLTNN
jgi:hypothetical protein